MRVSTANVRYIVDDVDAAIGFYGDLLGFEVVMHPALEVADVRGEIERLRAAGVRLRSELVEGVGGDQVLVMDPAGNLVELFQPHSR